MNYEYIIVQAGGKGSRLEHLTRNKPKALVPIENLPMIFHLFNKFPKHKFIIISDYQKDVMKRYLNVFANVNYLMVDASGYSGTCAGMSQALEYVPDNKSFMIIWSDIILGENFTLPAIGNYVGLSKDFECRWKFEDDIFSEEKSREYGVAGLFFFKDKSPLLKLEKDGEFVRWLSHQKIEFDTISMYGSREYGLLVEYEKLEKRKTRPFNELVFEENTAIKRPLDELGESLAKIEEAWYKEVSARGFPKIPKIKSYGPLAMEKIEGKNIYEYDFSPAEKKQVLEKIVNGIKELHSLGDKTTDYFSLYDNYVKKTFNRIEKVRDLIPFANEKEIVINNRVCRNIFYNREILDDFFDNYRVDKFKFIHGDCTFSNIMLRKDEELILIDPRGYFGDVKFYGDENYDWAKLYYSIVGDYDQFNLKNFNLSIEDKQIELEIETNGWNDMADYFFELIGEEKKQDILFIHALIWLSLTTYAWEDYDSICGAFYNGLYYLEELL